MVVHKLGMRHATTAAMRLLRSFLTKLFGNCARGCPIGQDKTSGSGASRSPGYCLLPVLYLTAAKTEGAFVTASIRDAGSVALLPACPTRLACLRPDRNLEARSHRSQERLLATRK